MKTAVCTLFEGSHHIGAAALANSLHASGFRGTLWAGFRGELPPWAAAARADDAIAPHAPGALCLAPAKDFSIVFVPLDTPGHLTNHKPAFLQRVLGVLAPDAGAAVYLDPDIVVKCPWESVFPLWLDGGIALVEDINASMPARHPRRLAWTRWLAAHGQAPRPGNARERYYNAGFIGVPRAHAPFLVLWQNIIELSRETTGADPSRLKNGGPNDLFHSADQDALNIALMTTDAPVNAAGPDAMDFAPGGHYLSHATGTPKPWQSGHLLRALRGYPPSAAVKNFHLHTEHPIAIYPPAQRLLRRVKIALAAFIGRLYRRT